MTTPSRFAVPLTELDRVQVESAEQVQEQPEPRLHEPWAWQGVPRADGGGGDADGE